MQGLCGHVTLTPATVMVQPARLVAAHRRTSLGQVFKSTTYLDASGALLLADGVVLQVKGCSSSLLSACRRA